VFEEPKTKRSRRAVLLPAFVRDYLERQRESQRFRREALGPDWHEHGLVIDRGDGSPLNPDTLSTGWHATSASTAAWPRGEREPPTREGGRSYPRMWASGERPDWLSTRQR